MKSQIGFVFTAMLIILAGAHRSEAATGKKMFLDLGLFSGYSSVSSSSSAASPTLTQQGGGLTVGYALGAARYFMIGVSSDYRWVNQYSDTVTGNGKGTRWNIASPTLGFMKGKVILLGDFQFLGDYELSQTGLNGDSVSYSSPMGGRLRALYLIKNHLYGGLFYEMVSFSDIKTGTVKSTFTNPMTLWQAGLNVAFVF